MSLSLSGLGSKWKQAATYWSVGNLGRASYGPCRSSLRARAKAAVTQGWSFIYANWPLGERFDGSHRPEMSGFQFGSFPQLLYTFALWANKGVVLDADRPSGDPEDPVMVGGRSNRCCLDDGDVGVGGIVTKAVLMT